MAITTHTRESLIAFEERVRQKWEAGDLPSLMHLCGGNEGQLLDIFKGVKACDWVLTNHRAHYHCLLKGMSEEQLMKNIENDLSMFNFSKELRIYQSAILGGCCGIAVGIAQAIKEKNGTEWTHCFVGDGACENGAVHSAAMFVEGHRLPCTFYIEDNGRQVDTSKLVRRGYGWNPSKNEAYEPSWPSCVQRYEYTPRWVHAGSAFPGKITFKRTTPLT